MAIPSPLRISCTDCALEHTAACDDCVVTFILRREPDDAVVVEVDELRALRALGAGGLVPRLRHTGSARDPATRATVDDGPRPGAGRPVPAPQARLARCRPLTSTPPTATSPPSA